MPAHPDVGDPGTDMIAPPNDFASRQRAFLDVSLDLATGALRPFAEGPTFDPYAFGAAGNGVADDTTAVQDAINAAAAAGGGSVLLTSGTYLVSQIRMKSRVELRGTSVIATIQQKASTSGHMIILDSSTVFWTRVTNLLLDGNKSNQSATNDIIRYDHTGNAGDKWHRVDNCYIRNAKGNGITYYTGCQASYIHDCYLFSNDGYGIEVAASDNVLHNLSVGHSGKDGVYLHGCQGSRLTDVNSFWSGKVVTTSAAFKITSANEVNLVACFAQDSQGTGPGFDIAGTGHMLANCAAESNAGPILKGTNLVNVNADITVGPGTRATSTYAVDLSSGTNTGNYIHIHGFETGFTTYNNGALTGNTAKLNGKRRAMIGDPWSRRRDLELALGFTQGLDDGYANALAPSSQTIYGNAVYLYAGETVTNIIVCATTAAVGTDPTSVKLSLWSSAASPVCLAVSGELAADAMWDTQGWKEAALGTPYPVVTSGVYYAAFWINGSWAGTNIQLLTSAQNGPAGNKLGSNKWRRPSLKTGATSIAVNDTGTFGQVGGGVIILTD